MFEFIHILFEKKAKNTSQILNKKRKKKIFFFLIINKIFDSFCI